MTSVPEIHIHALGHSLSVNRHVLRRVVTFLVGTFGIVFVTLMAWVVLLVAR
jgi:hypothetical protein